MPRPRALLPHARTLLLLALAMAATGVYSPVYAQTAAPAAAAPRAALTVTLTRAERQTLATTLAANGNVAAWQEASVGAEAQGMRLAELRAEVGDVVRRGQVLAVFAPEMINAELAQARAAVAEAEAQLAEAVANANRARELRESGALSAQDIASRLTAEQTARARLEAARAAEQVQRLRLAHTQVLAPDAGVISARNATVGAVVPAGTELFRLIRQGRLEWRAEVTAGELARLRPGQRVTIAAEGLPEQTGTVRRVAPTVDPATRNALVHVDLPAPAMAAGLRPGMFARGAFVLGDAPALTLPASAVLLRDGFSVVFTVDEANRVAQRKVRTGRRSGERVEIVEGLDDKARVVASGAGFLADGDTVRVVAGPAPAATASR